MVTLLLAFAIFLYTSTKWQWADWTGFGEDSTISQEETLQDGKLTVTKRITQVQSGKTLWDWLGLAGVIAIPVVLFQFQQQQQKKSEENSEAEKRQAAERAKVEKEIAATNLREEALQNYIDKIAELLIDKDLKLLLKHLSDGSITKDEPELDAALDVARARTLSILRRLDGDGERKSSVVRFLIDAELIQGLELLKEANLSKANLSGVNFSRADLSRANLFKANLFKANFSEAKLFKANFSEANLSEANFGSAGLTEANLKGVKNLTPEQIKEARNWEKANYDPDFREQLGLPPKFSSQ
ncbi:MAG TPA: pentapeptide repeat-containing protein [Stenomitos sp.]